MPENKKHHYVPRFHLENFSDDGKRINLFNLPSQRSIFGAPLRGQCCKNYFYGRDLIVEKVLVDVEGNAATVLRKIATDRVLPVHASEDYQHLFLFLLIQSARTSYQVDLIDDRHDAYWQHAYLPYMDQSKGPLPTTAPRCSDPGAAAIRSAVGHLRILFDLDYKLLTIADDQEFVTSDNPVVLYNQMYEFVRIGGTAGLANKGLQIFFPIDTKNLLMVYDPRVYSVGKRREQNVLVTGEHDVGQLNLLQFVAAQCNVYFHGAALDIDNLHRKATKYYRKEKSRVQVFGQKSSTPGEQLIVTADVDVQTSLHLSFVQIVKREKFWLRSLRKSKGRAIPLPIARNKQLVDMNMAFLDAIDKGECGFEDFESWFMQRYRAGRS